MKTLNKKIGFYGESLASDYLISKNHKIIKKNFFSKHCEIDLISLDKEILVFTEVKSRMYFKFGTPLESINFNKIKNIKKTALYYIHKNNEYNRYIRFDVIEIFLSSTNSDYKINHLEDAFR